MTRQRGLVLLLALAALGAAGCTGSGSHGPATHASAPPSARAHATTPTARLAAYRSCADAVASLRRATTASVTAYGLSGGPSDVMFGGVDRKAASGVATAPQASAASQGGAAPQVGAAAGPAYSGTNTAVPGVDEPDLVKTDGRRIVVIEGDQLTVVDAATRQVTGRLLLPAGGGPGPSVPAKSVIMPFAGTAANLLLSGDHALVLGSGYGPVPGAARSVAGGSRAELLLVDLSGTPRVVSSYSIDGSVLDARQVGSVVRVVTQTAPRVVFPVMAPSTSQARLLAVNRATIQRAAADAWLPGYTSTSGATTVSGTVPCTAVSHPGRYSGTSMLTVETFDLTSAALGSGSPVSIEADGDTVYGTASSLYIASGNQWTGPAPARAAGARPLPAGVRQQTEIYRFDITGTGAPRFAASGAVPGYLVDQYAMSEWNGYLRVATTTGLSWAVADGPSPAGASAPASSSAVYSLSLAGPAMPVAGKVAGLGSGERIYSVRFNGPVGYVVTFRQTDPLYTVDLSDPVHPRVVGSLSLTGYSAYLHPVSGSQLIGIGQSADSMGHVGGMQVSLFDVTDLAAPIRLATYALAGSSSTAEFDPHAFLYWPSASLVVVPLDAGAQTGDLVLRLSGGSLTKAGLLQVPGPAQGSIQRSLVIGGTLWTVSPGGLLASDLGTLHQEAWVRLAPIA
jgi:uncharacterized secreted protein with C-terminal beta-propeller domain